MGQGKEKGLAHRSRLPEQTPHGLRARTKRRPPRSPHWHADHVEWINETALALGIPLETENEDWISKRIEEAEKKARARLQNACPIYGNGKVLEAIPFRFTNRRGGHMQEFISWTESKNQPPVEP